MAVPILIVSCVSHHVQIRCPKLKLPAPVDDGGERGTDDETATVVEEMSPLRKRKRLAAATAQIAILPP